MFRELGSKTAAILKPTPFNRTGLVSEVEFGAREPLRTSVDAETSSGGTREAESESFIAADAETFRGGPREAAPERFFAKEVDVETAGAGTGEATSERFIG